MPGPWTRLAPAVALLLAPATAAAGPPDVLRLVPAEAGLVAVVESPRKLAEAVTGHDAVRAAQTLPAVRDALDSSAARRFFQLVAYYERELGAPWPDLLGKLAGGGLAVGAAVGGPDPAPALLVAKGTDEAAVAQFTALATRLLEQEVARQAAVGDAPGPAVRRAARHGVETLHLGPDFHAARVGATLYVANKEAALNAGLDLARDPKPGRSVADRPGPAAARALLGGDPLAWAWFDFAKVKEGKATKDFFATTRKDFLQTVVLGSSIDAFRRADFVAAGLWQTPGGFRAAVRLPAARADLPKDLAGLHAPPAGRPGSLPLLEPPGVLYSQSFYLDLGTLWAERKSLINDQQRKDIEKAEKDISKVVPGTTLGKLLEMSGPYHRVVVAGRAGPPPYKTRPDDDLPPAALVLSMRDPRFGKAAASALRAAGFLGSVQAGLKMSEETYDGVPVVVYRFPEGRGFPGGDPENVRFNFVPAFAVVGDSVVAATDPGLVKALIPELRTPAAGEPGAPVWRAKGYGAGAAGLLRAAPEAAVADAVLERGVGLAEARREVDALAAFLAGLGSLGLTIDHRPDAYGIEIEWTAK